MHDTPKYTLGESDDLSITVFHQCAGFYYDSYLIVRPEESHSGVWEVWYAEMENGSNDLLPIHKQLEITSPWVTDFPHVHLVLQSMRSAYEVGEHDGVARMLTLNRFAHSVFTGRSGWQEMSEAADEAGFGIEEDGSDFAKRSSSYSSA